MTTTPELLASLTKSIAEIQSAVDMMLEDCKADPELDSDMSPDFALEASLDFLDPEDFPELGQFAGEFLDLVAKMANG